MKREITPVLFHKIELILAQTKLMFLLIVCLMFLSVISAKAGGTSYMTVGQTKTLYFSTSKVIKSATWYSASASIVEVTSYGVTSAQIKAVKSFSSYVIVRCDYYYWVTSGKYSYLASGAEDFKIYVDPINPTNISIPSSTTINIGYNKALTPTLTPSNAETSLTWSSNNTTVATVNSSGTIYALNPGTAYITVKTSNNLSSACKVTVPEPSPTITSFTPTSAYIGSKITIVGTNFTGTTAVSFGGIAATSFTVVSANSITAVIATGTSGSVSVTTSSGTATLAGFTFIPNLTITSGLTVIDKNTTVNNLTVYPAGKITLSAGKTLKVLGNLTLQSNAKETASFVDQGGTLSVNGTTSVQQYLTGAGGATPSGRFWYISIPVSSATSALIDAAGMNKVWYYNEPTHAYNEITDNTTALNVGTGYVARLGANDTVTFSGTLNTGNQTFYTTRTGTDNDKRGFNLVGNPYPSYLDWTAANKTNLMPTIWFRSMNSSNNMVFDTYNALLGTGISASGNPITQYIPPIQAFWVRVDSDGDTGILGFTNAMRSHQTGSLKSGETNDLIRLQVSNGINRDETVIAFNSCAGNGFESFDSPKMSNKDKEIPELYTVADSEHIAINGLESVATNETIPLGFKTAKNGTFTISLNEIEGLNDIPVILEDKLLNLTQDLTQSPTYVFTSDSSDNTNRFVVHLKSSETTSVNIEQSDIAIYTKEHSLIVKSSIESNEGIIMVFDVLGREVLIATLSGTQTIIDLPLNAGAYFVKVGTNKSLVTKNIIVQ